MRKKTLEEFKKDIFSKYGNDYIVLADEYVNNKTAIKIQHKCGKIFFVRPDIFLNNYKEGCPICSNTKKRKTDEQFKKELFEKYNGEYIPLDTYKNADTKMHIKHTACGMISFVLPARILAGDRCKYCYGSIRKDIASFKKEIWDMTNGKISVISDEYHSNKEKMIFRCEICKKNFISRPNNILSGCGCPHCNKSKGETIIANILEQHGIPFTREKTFKDLLSDNNKHLRFDFEIYLNNTQILLEFDGEQHFHSNRKFSKEEVRENHRRDIKKNAYCIQNNILLMRIPFTEFKKLSHIITNLISSTTIPDEFKVVDSNGSKSSAELYNSYNPDDIV